MSGIAAVFGKPNGTSPIEAMLKRMRHRGKDKSGVFQYQQALLGQNYFRADLGESVTGEVPVFLEGDPNLRICYDGQIGNWAKLARQHGVADGPFREERLLLDLFITYGAQMLDYLNDAVFAFVISDGRQLFAARDLLGIKTLFYGKTTNTFYFSSELKGLSQIDVDPIEFPPGHYLTEDGELVAYNRLAKAFPNLALTSPPEEIADKIGNLIRQSIRQRIDFQVPTACLLSGGLDSSVIAYEGSELYREKYGDSAQLETFAFGVGESEDIINARVMAKHLNTAHHELIVGLEQILEVLPEVIYYLESFDPSLVRSAVSNYLISRYAREEGYEILLSGEGGDEAFCGYTYFKQFSGQELYHEQVRCLGFIHNNASLRLDRMNMCNSIKVVAPLASGELLSYALGIPAEYKIRMENGTKIEKWIFRKAYEGKLPDEIVWRVKQEFSQGSGSAGLLPDYFEKTVDEREFTEAQKKYAFLRSKEEWHYFRIFKEHYGDGAAVDTVGQWVGL